MDNFYTTIDTLNSTVSVVNLNCETLRIGNFSLITKNIGEDSEKLCIFDRNNKELCSFSITSSENTSGTSQ